MVDMDTLSTPAASFGSPPQPVATTASSTSLNQLDASSHGQPNHPASTTSAATDAPKVSMMTKSGLNFVIPKNKLSGSLVPVSRGPGKCEPVDSKKDESSHPSRKTRWGSDLTQDLSVKRGRALALQTRAEQLAAQLESGNLDVDNSEATLSSSPRPVYDSLSRRMNEREGRTQEQSDIERREAIEECIKLNPSYKPPSGFKPVPKEAKLYIPTREYPGYNLISLMLDHGNIQKRMEAETGTKIRLRGKGAIKEGKLPVHNGKDMDGDLEGLHVHISADSYDKVDAAVEMIKTLLTPINLDQNVHQIKQFKELPAETNGILQVCAFCCEVGHREWHCPKDKLHSFQAKGKTTDREYLNFLEEFGAGLGSLGKISTDTSQPMLLTASGAQPMPAKWMVFDSSDGQNPKFPFPVPTGLQGSNALNILLPRFFHGLFRGGAIPPMMARMFSTFLEKFPSPPGLNPDIRMPVPSEESAPLQREASGQVQLQASGSDGNQPTESTSVDGQNQNASIVSVIVSSAGASSFPSNTEASSSMTSASSFVPQIQFQGNPISMHTAINNRSPAIPPALLSSVIPNPVTVPMRPVIPSIRPAFRPVVSVPSQAGPGFWTAGNNATNGNNVQPAESWTGATAWGQGQYSQQQSYLHLERAIQPAVTAQQVGSDGTFASRSWSSNPASIRLPSIQSAVTPGHGPPNVNLPPVQPSSIRPIFPPNPVGQFAMPVSEQLAPHPIGHANPKGGYIQSGSQILLPNNAPSAHSSVPLFSSVNHQMHASQQNFPFQPLEMPPVHRAQVPSPAVEFPSGLHNLRQDGSFLIPISRSYVPINVPSDPTFNDQRRQPPLFPSHSLDPSIPRHVLPSVPSLEQRMRIGGQLNANVGNSTRAILPQAWRQSEANVKWTGNAANTRTSDVDPEYEKLMASVGVL